MSAEQQVSDTPSGGICIPSADSMEKIVYNTVEVMGHVPGCLTDGCRCYCACVRDAISTSSTSQDAETSQVSVQFVGNVVVAAGITNTCGTSARVEAPLLPDPVNELRLGDDLTGNEQCSSDGTPAAHVSRSQGTVSLAQDKVSEEGNASGCTKEPASVYTGMKDVTGWRSSDSELSGISAEGRIAVDNWMDADSYMVVTGDLMQDHSMEMQWGQDSPKLAGGVCMAPHTEDYAGKLMDKTQACVEISPRNLDEEWWFPHVDEDNRGTLDTQEEVWLGQEFSEPNTASFILACGYVTAATTGLGMEAISLWNMVVESHDHRKVTVCTIDEIFRIPEYSDAVQESQSSKVHKTGHTKHAEFPEGQESGATQLSASTSNPPALYSICPSRRNNSEIPNITTALDPSWWEGALPTDPTLGGEQKLDKNLLHESPKTNNKLSRLNSRSMHQITLTKEAFDKKFLEDSKVQTEDTEQIKFLSDKQPVSDSHKLSSLTFENESLSSGDPLQVVTIDPKQNESIHTVRELSQELSRLIILTGDRLMLSKEGCIAYFTLDLHVMSDYTASLCAVDVHCQMSLEKTKNICKTEDKERVRMAPSKSETHWDCEMVPRQQPGADIASCVIKTWEAETRTTKQGECLSSEPPLVPALLTQSKGKEKQSATMTKTAATSVTKSCGEEKRKHSSTQTKSFHFSTANENLLNLCHSQGGLQTEINSRKDKLPVSHPVRNKRDKVSGAVVHKRPYTEVGEDQLLIKKEAPRVLQDIWVERDEAASVGLRLQCLLGHITSDCTIIWSKDGTVLAEEKGSTGDVHQISLCIAGGSRPDLGMYRCLLSSTHGQACSEYHLTLEALRELIPKQQNTEEVQGVREDVKCAPLLFKEDFLCEQYFGDHEMASIITEGVHFGEGMHRRAFRTQLLEGMVTAFRPGQHCVLKVHNSLCYGTRCEEELLCRNYSLAVEECYVQNTAREYIRAYREVAKAAETFGEVPDIIPIYLVHRPSNDIPYATLEEELIGDFVKYSVRDGREVNLMRRESEAGQKCCAFQHWVYHKTEGNLLVTDMQGVGMKLTDVGIATCRKGYKGFRGNCSTSFIDQFRTLHQCNRFCGLLGLQALQSDQPKPKRTGNDPKLKPKKKTLTSVVKNKS